MSSYTKFTNTMFTCTFMTENSCTLSRCLYCSLRERSHVSGSSLRQIQEMLDSMKGLLKSHAHARPIRTSIMSPGQQLVGQAQKNRHVANQPTSNRQSLKEDFLNSSNLDSRFMCTSRRLSSASTSNKRL